MRAATPEQHIATLHDASLAREIDRIVEHVKASRLVGERQARRFVGRRLNRNTLAYWRVYGMFPVGFRDGSKPAPARIYNDGRGRR